MTVTLSADDILQLRSALDVVVRSGGLQVARTALDLSAKLDAAVPVDTAPADAPTDAAPADAA